MKKYIEKNSLLCLLSGLLSGVCFSFGQFNVFIWITFIPLIYVFLNHSNNYKKILKYGIIFGFSYYIVVLHWIFNLYPLDWIDLSKGQSILILLGGWIGIAFLEGLLVGFTLSLYKFIKTKNNNVNIIIFAFLWITLEFIQSLGTLGFTWGRIAVSQVNFLTIIQSASLFGSLFIGFLIILFNGLLCLNLNYNFKFKIKKVSIGVAISLFVLNIGYGFLSLNKNYDGKEANIVLLQGNIPTAQKWNSNSGKEHMEIYTDLMSKGIKEIESNGEKADIVFWPETALPYNLAHNEDLLNQYKNLAIENDVMIATGAFHTEFEEVEKDYNSIYFIDNKGNIDNIYSKRHLVPFGEMLPFENVIYKVLPFLSKMNLFNGSLYPGESAEVTTTQYGKIGSVICFESIFSDLILDNIKDGAEALFIATNDSWFKSSRAVYQHNAQAVLRAVETNRYLVRAANTGISSVINNKGEVIKMIEPMERGYISSKIKFISENTLYSKIGDLIVFIGLGFIIIIQFIKRRFI